MLVIVKVEPARQPQLRRDRKTLRRGRESSEGGPAVLVLFGNLDSYICKKASAVNDWDKVFNARALRVSKPIEWLTLGERKGLEMVNAGDLIIAEQMGGHGRIIGLAEVVEIAIGSADKRCRDG